MLLILLDPDPAKIIDYSSSVLVVDSNQAELNIKCIVTGYPEPNITWRKDGNVIHTCYFPQRDCRYIEQHDSLGRHVGLQISRPRYPDDHGVFSCEAANGNGFDIRNFTVIVPGVFSVKYTCDTDSNLIKVVLARQPLRTESQ